MKEDKIKRYLVSILAALILITYTYYIISHKLKDGVVEMSGTDKSVVSVCLVVLLAMEAFKYYLRKKLGKDDSNAN